MPKQIIFKIDTDPTSPTYGKLSTDASGFKGEQCIKDVEKLLEGLSVTRESRRLKAEYNEQKTGTKIVAQG